MIRKNKYYIVSIALTLAWTYFIFRMSLQTADESSQLSGGIVAWISSNFFVPVFGDIPNLEHYVRKLAHFTEFGVLGVLATGACRNKWICAGLYCIIVAAIDETIQLFVPGRAGMMTDVFIDSSGAICGVLIWMFLRKLVKGVPRMNSVKILQVLDRIEYNSGVSSVVMNYFHYLDREKVQMDFLLFEMPEERFREFIESRGSKIYITGQPSGRNMVTYEKAVERFFDTSGREYGVVHVHIPNTAFVILRYAKLAGVQWRILHSHNARGADGLVKKARNFVLNRWGALYANRYFACSKAAGAYLFGKKTVEEDKVFVLPNAIDLDKFAFSKESRERLRQKLGVEEKELLLGHIGRFVEQKNHRQLLNIFKAVRDGGINAKLVLLGDGVLRREIEAQIRELDLLEQVLVCGVVGNAADYLSAMDVFLLPSLYEGLPVVCVEAQAAGLPCILADTVTKEIGLSSQVKYIPSKDIEAWVEEIKEISYKPEASDRDHIAEALRTYDIRLQAKELERIYLEYGQNSNSNVNI